MEETKIAGGHVYKVEEITLEQELESIDKELIDIQPEIDNAQSVVEAWTGRRDAAINKKLELSSRKSVIEQEIVIKNTPAVEEVVVEQEVVN